MARDFVELGYKRVEVSDLKSGQTILFDEQKDNEQAYVVLRILQVPNSENIIVECYPETALVANSTIFHYGMKNFRIKN